MKILEKYYKNIIIEVGAHDHLSDIRYHSNELASSDVSKDSPDYWFHN
jgi:hypothetical protein